MMGQIIITRRGNYTLSDPAPASLASQRDLLELLSLSGEDGSDRLLITEGSLHPDFFDLSTGLAGEICLKLSTYRIKTAIVVQLDRISSQRFREWAGECNRGREIYFSSNREEAEDWLLDQNRG
jgi:hypothetical protein